MKILSAWVEQNLLFDDDYEFHHYLNKLKNSSRAYDIERVVHDEQTGKISVHIRKQYNNNTFQKGEKNK